MKHFYIFYKNSKIEWVLNDFNSAKINKGGCGKSRKMTFFRTCLVAGIKRVTDCLRNPATLCRQSAFQIRPEVCESYVVCGIADLRTE